MKVGIYFSLVAAVMGTAFATASAQDYNDALRYSYLIPQGTAAAMGAGGATGSLGNDFSSLSINPAGLGLYKRGELVLTPNVQIGNVNGQYLGNTMSDNNTHFSFSNASVVFTSAPKGRRAEKSQWKAVSFAIGVNKLADFNRNYAYSGNNSGANSSSQSERYEAAFKQNAGDTANPGSDAYMGWYSYLLDTTGSTLVPWKDGINQARYVQERGSINEIDISLGGNYMNKWMLGVTLGIPIINHSIASDYTETALNSDPNFTSYTLHENLTTNGSGVNLKLGAIYKFSDYFRIGAAIHTPTWYSMHDQYDATLTNNTPSVYSYIQAPTNVFDYQLITPWRGVLSATGFIGHHAFISADYEYVDYSSARFNFGGDYLSEQDYANQQIRQNLQAASNVRVGAGVYLTQIFMLRAGFGYYGNPYKTSGEDGSSMVFSGGFGFHFPKFFIDGSFMHTQYNTSEQPYLTPYSNVTVPTATLKNSVNNAALTLGFKFRG